MGLTYEQVKYYNEAMRIAKERVYKNMPTARERANEGYEAGHDLGVYFGRLFWVIGTVNDAQRVGQWFAEHSGYTEMGPALGFVNGYSDGLMEAQPQSAFQLEPPKSTRKTEKGE